MIFSFVDFRAVLKFNVEQSFHIARNECCDPLI